MRSSSATLSTLGGILVAVRWKLLSFRLYLGGGGLEAAELQTLGGGALEAAELQTFNQLRSMVLNDDDGERQRARERGVYICTKGERRRAALTAEHNKAFALSRL